MAQPAITAVTLPIDGVETTITVEEALAEGRISTDVALQLAQAPLALFVPERQGLRFVNGLTMSPEFVALLLALVVYTAAFIAEIVRAGILAVPYGQLEAGRAIGLTQSQMMRMIILPQALRVIIPPLTNQYLNLAKNSSLAIAISYADVYAVMNTVGNQSGQSVTSIIIVMITYLVLSLLISLVMNWVNARFQLVTR
jgi:general L-amino acid transport system permease protein